MNINKKYVFVLLLLISLVTISSVSANDLNVTDVDLTSSGDEFTDDSISTSIDSESGNNLSNTNVIYFDASASYDGDGSQSNPFKYVNQNTLNRYISSGNDVTAYFANGVYTLNTPFKISSNVVLIGEDPEKTIFDSVLSNKYDFEIMRNSNLELHNMSFRQVNIINHGNLKAVEVGFNGSEAFKGNNAPFTYNYNSSYGGVIICDPIGNSRPYVYLNGCYFESNSAYCGGIISLKNSILIANDSYFYNSYAERQGGSIYAVNSIINCSSSTFYMNNATYGGIMYCENSTVDLYNNGFYNSSAYSFGGMLALKYSNVTVDTANFWYYYSSTNAGGAIYNFKGNLYIRKAYFFQGEAEFGGAICNLDASLTVNSSFFEVNIAGSGGVIYNMYGKMFIVNNTFHYSIDYSEANTICSKLSDSVFLINNTFVNSNSKAILDGTCVLIESGMDFTQYNNHFEDLFRVNVELNGYVGDEEIFVRSNDLNYVVSNTGVYYVPYFQDVDAYGGDFSSYCRLKIYDSEHPDSSTIFGNYNNDFNINFDYFSYSNKFHDTKLYFRVYNYLGDLIYEIEYDENVNSNFKLSQAFSFKSFMLIITTGSRFTVEEAVTSPINSTLSNLSYIPSHYDSRDYGYVTPVKDQAEGGNCWAFAGIATLETCIKKITNITYDFSEENVKNMMSSFSTMGLDLQPNRGGYDSMVMGYLTSWFGPTLEKYDPYDDLSTLSIPYTDTQFHIQNIYFLPPRENELYDYIYKKAIMDYGAVAIVFNVTGRGYHAVSLVGWDDNYIGFDSLDKYTKGAWIFKNSWGSDWGDNGFGYLSYDTPFASDDFYTNCYAYTFIFNKNDHYLVNSHSDFSGVTDYIWTDGPAYLKYSLGTVESMDGHGVFSAVATYFKVPTNYTIEVLDKTTNQVLLYQEGYSEAGYHTIPFDNPVEMYVGGNFMFIIGFCNEESNYLPVCQAEELTRIYFTTLESFCSFDGVTFFDLFNYSGELDFLFGGTKSNTCQEACIHIFTDTTDPLVLKINVSEFDNLDIGETVSVNITIDDSSLVDSGYFSDHIGWINGTLITLNIDGKDYYAMIHDGKASLNISFDNAGIHTLTARYISNGHDSNTVSFNFTVNQIDTSTSLSSTKNSYDNVTLTANINSLNASGIVVFNVNGVEYFAELVNGTAFVILSGLDVGPYTANATYKGSTNYKVSSSSTISFNVNEADFHILAPDVVKYFHGSERFVVNVCDNEDAICRNKTVIISINGVPYTRVTDEYGNASIALGVGAGTYNVSTRVDDVVVNSVVTVLTTVNGSNVIKVFRNGTQYYATFKDTKGNYLADGTTIRFNINGVFYDRKVSGDYGLARLNLNLVQGEYILTAINTVTGEESSNLITVIPKIIENRDITKYFRNGTQFSVKVLGDDGKTVGAGKEVTFNINGVLYKRSTNESGIAKMNINLNPGEYVITTEYGGCVVSNTIKILPTLIASDLTKKFGTSNPFVATFVDGQGKPLAGQNVMFNINGVFYTRTTNSTGQAKLNINLVQGVYIITSMCNDAVISNKVTVIS